MIVSWQSARKVYTGGLLALLLVTSSSLMPGCSKEEQQDAPFVEGWPPPRQATRKIAQERRSSTRTLKKDAHSESNHKLGSSYTACQRLVERACGLLGVFSQECIEARSQAKSISKPSELKECEQVLSTFELTHATDIRRNPCSVLARRVCADRGRETKECKDRQTSVKQLTRASDREACRGDLLLEEARGVLQPDR